MAEKYVAIRLSATDLRTLDQIRETMQSDVAGVRPEATPTRATAARLLLRQAMVAALETVEVTP